HPKVKLVRAPIDWKTIESIPDTFLISTQYGFMFLKPHTFETPLTCLNMYNLAKANFFANNYIHRVVPNFVIQSGDNTGTGEGGPGYAIRTEIAPIRYDDMGVVGMASSGKDTEGSQWFITHCPTPHLNTRYTIWADIVKGRENIEKYMLNDQITNIVPYK
ncbi:MAG: peptidylprolyl isomerase, partial [Ignavibacteriota bacterium]